MGRILEGIKVVEVALFGFVPSAGAALADWGADVVKIEHPETGDPVRALSSYGFGPGDGGVTTLWEVFNRGKRGVGIDIATPDGLELLMCLIDEADVFITSFMPSARERLGIDVDQVRARNPRIIYGRGTGQGPVGPDADKGGFDGISYWSRSGASTASVPPGYDFPILLPGPAFGDIQSGMFLAGGIAGALYQRERTGQGSVVDVSLFGAGLWAMQASIAGAAAIGADNIVQLDRRRPPNPLTNLYRTADGHFFVLGMLQADRYWPGLCAVLGHPELAADERFTTLALRTEHAEACVAALDAIFTAMTYDELVKALDSQEGQWAPVAVPGDTLTDPQALANGYVQQVDYPSGARLPLVPVPARVDGDLPTLTPAPTLGEHTNEVVLALGRSEEELINLKIAGVIS
ncbi:CaiB/BaiF CoA transferase family protein [Frankia tisae]|uniref:CaiB/BaiF CoA transferase family protein n=1 Tax=Frankia tisae TaxID=2950104 RepID=UPI0021C12063|nr:CoA transferase [Frankia tisae]